MPVNYIYRVFRNYSFKLIQEIENIKTNTFCYSTNVPWQQFLMIGTICTDDSLACYSSSTQRWSLNKCASEERNIEKVRQKIKVFNHSANKARAVLAKTQSGSLFTIRCYGDHSELPNRNLQNPLDGWLLCYDTLASHTATTRNYLNCQAPHFNWQHRNWLEKL